MSEQAEIQSDGKNEKRGKSAIRVYCTLDERHTIETNASKYRKSLSQYLRTLGMGMVFTHSVDNVEQVKTLARINADLGRLGGLLKALLTNDERVRGRSGEEIAALTRETLEKIGKNQTQMHELLRGVRLQ